MKRRLQRLTVRFQEQRGQSIVLLAGAMVGLLVFAGLAVDAGVIYMGSIHLSRSVDAAVLAGVVELPDCDATGSSCYSAPFETRTCYADGKAQDFLWANGITTTVAITGTEFFLSSRETGVIGSYRYRITATHQVDLYFLPLVDFNYVRLRDTALAEYNPWVDIYTDQSGALGILKTANQSFKGRSESSARGDAFSPTGSPWYDELQGKYIYRIYVPSGYAYDTVRVEILDPDDYDGPKPTQTWISTTVPVSPTGEFSAYVGCRGTSGEPDEEQNDGSSAICSNPTTDPANPLWFLALDESTSSNPIQFTLFYYELLADGTLVPRDIAQYTSTGGDNSQGTDMMWVSPGAAQAWDYAGTGVPDDTQQYGWVPEAGDGNFEIQVKGSGGEFGEDDSEVPGIYRAPTTGDIYIYLEAESQGAHTENSFELWAGPDLSVYPDVPGNVNYRNVYIIIGGLEQAHGSGGVIVYAVGHMPFNSNSINRTEMQLADIPAAWAGRRVRIDYFDVDTNTKPPFIFYFDTMPQQDWQVCYDDTSVGCNHTTGTQCETTANGDCWHIPTYGYRCADFGPADDPFQPEPTTRAFLVDGGCSSGVSNNQWHTYEFILPPQEVFYGGRLKVSYGGGNTDNVTFRMMVESVPRLEQ